MKTEDNKAAVATLTLSIRFDESLPPDIYLEELMDKAREEGRVVVADFTIHKQITKSLV